MTPEEFFIKGILPIISVLCIFAWGRLTRQIEERRK